MFTLLSIFFLLFTDKVGSERICLSPTAIEMREERGIAIDQLDYEVSPLYVDSVQALGAKVLHTSRWFNGATVQASDEVIKQIQHCSFIDTVYLTRRGKTSLLHPSLSLRKRDVDIALDQTENSNSKLGSNAQHHLLNLLPLHQAGYNGQGIRIGVADGGFYHADELASLPHDQWLGYADFTDDKDDFFGTSGSHGTLCLSAIVAQKRLSDTTSLIDLHYRGAATEAEYFLFRTEEHSTESPKEIDNWVAAIEMADSLGLHIVSTSLGYTQFDDRRFDFSYADMDGRTSRGAQAATIATRKGLLLVMAIGNDGNKAWHYLSTPADADSVITVGAVDINRNIAEFSSYGPSADGRIKPEVCAVGKETVLINPSNNMLQSGNGTSFACPLIAGMAACLWSALPHASNMEIRERIIRSADRYTQPHEHYGYGIPNTWLAYTMSLSTHLPPIHRTSNTEKILRDGQIYIINQGQTYDLLGTKIN